MKEYVVFVGVNGDIELFCGGQISMAAHGEGFEKNAARILRQLKERGELMQVLCEQQRDEKSGERTFTMKVMQLL
jgi:hypothetical protein